MYKWTHGSAEKAQAAVQAGEKNIISETDARDKISLKGAKERAEQVRRDIEELEEHTAFLRKEEASLLSLLAEWDAFKKKNPDPADGLEAERDSILEVFEKHKIKTDGSGKPFYYVQNEPASNIKEEVANVFMRYGLQAVEIEVFGLGRSGSFQYFLVNLPKHQLKTAVSYSHSRGWDGKASYESDTLYFESLESIKAERTFIEPSLEPFM